MEKSTAQAFQTTDGRLFLAIAVCAILYAWGNGNFAALSKVRIVIADPSTVQPAGRSTSPLPVGEGVGLATIEAIPTDFIPDQSAAMTNTERSADQRRRDYLKKYAPLAVAERKKFGIPASITLAQGLLESNAGESKLARQNNNHFGVKCFSRKCKTGHCTNATDDTHKDFFVRYKSAWESYRAHSKLVTTGRFAGITGDYRAWASELQRRGYATSDTYAADLIRIIELYSLRRLDQ